MNNIANIRTHFSLGQSILKPDAAVKNAKELGYDTVCVTDKCSVSAMTEVVSACAKHEMQYIIGATLPIHEEVGVYEKGVKTRAQYELKVLVRTEEGLHSLFKLLSRAYNPERFYYEPRLIITDCNKETLQGLVVTTGDLHSIFAFRDYQVDMTWLESVAEHLWVEQVAVNQPYFARINEIAKAYATEENLECWVTRPALYLESQSDFRDLAQLVSTNSQANSTFAPKPVTRDFHLYAPEKLEERIRESGFRCSIIDFNALFKYRWKKQEMSLPKLAENESSALIQLCKEGWKDRLAHPTFGETLDKTRLAEYNERLKYELGVIQSMGFCAYFLLVHYVVNWSKDNEILVGPARGSAAGSLVAYLLKITDVDPLRFGLIFERFLNPDRLDYPDIDLDFMSSRRDEIIQHLIDKFGEDHVSGIANYNTLGSASALRDVGRISGLPIEDFSCSKLVPKEHGQSVDLEQAVQEVTEIENYAAKYPTQWHASVALQGTVRAMGQHAAGIVVAGEPVINRGVVTNNKDIPVVNWDKRIVEDWGLIKLDVLGLATLDIIKIALNTLAEQGHEIDLWKIPLDDLPALKVFSEGRTRGVFQFESGTARSLLRDIAVAGDFNFNDIVAVNALNRPGPLDAGLAEKYVKIRQGKFAPVYPHPKTESALGETMGVIVYQEQIMQMARDLCDFSMAEADVLRKAIGKKDPEKMKTMRDKFVEGAVKNGMLLTDVEQLWDAIEGFAAYSFNKSHAVAYSLIAYMSAYLKANYAGAFYAASMTVLAEDKVRLIAKEASEDGFVVMPPDINRSTDRFEIHRDLARDTHTLYSPLTAVKNVSAKVCQHILEVRNTLLTGFESYQHFFDSVMARKCNIRAKENLIAVGAFASIEPTQEHPLHHSRLRDQKTLMGALAVSDVKPDRAIDMSPTLKHKISELYLEMGENGREPVLPTTGSKPKFVVVTDKPHYFEVQEGFSLKGKASNYIRHALKANGLKPSEGYFTHLVKTQPESKKELTREEIAYYGEYLRRELDLINPPVVILAGTKALRYFFPDAKGSAEELSRTVEYDSEADRNYIFCINPQMIYIKPEKQELLNVVFNDVAELFDLTA